VAVAEPAGIEARLSALESRVEEVAADASAARHLAAAHDRDLADLGVKVDANRKAINALAVQTAARFDRLDGELRAGLAEVNAKVAKVDAKVDAGFAEVDAGFAGVRATLDRTAAGHQQIVGLLDHVIARLDDR
jgi:hypothetical protein